MLSVETKPEVSVVDQMLSLVDKTKLEATLQYLSCERFSNVDLTWHLKQWAKNKAHLFKLLGNKLKVEKEVDSVLSKSTMMEFYREFAAEALENQNKYILAYQFLSQLEIEEIATNSMMYNKTFFDAEFKVGAKVSRIFAKLVNKNYVHDIQTKYSMFLQKLKAKGKAVVSIDPIDYLTMSENKSGWRSCHALDGEYRTGTLAYMVDESTMIGYVKTSEDVVINNDKLVPYSNKTWRQVVVVNKGLDFSIQGRQYPSEMPNNSTGISDLMINCFTELKQVPYTFTKESCSMLDRVIHDADHEDERLWYNDFSAGAFNYGNIVHEARLEADDILQDCDAWTTITVGSDVRCVESSNWLLSSAYLSYNNYCENQEDEDDWDNDYDNDEDNDANDW